MSNSNTTSNRWYIEAHKNTPHLHNVTMKVYAITKDGLRQRQEQTFLNREDALEWYEDFKARHPGEPITTATVG